MRYSIFVGALAAAVICAGCKKSSQHEASEAASSVSTQQRSKPAEQTAPKSAETSTTQPTQEEPPATSTTADPKGKRVLTLKGITLNVPEHWKVEPISAGPFAAKAAFRIPGEDSSGDCVVRVTHYPSMKGKDDLNIDRWASQFRLADGSPATRRNAMITTSTHPKGTIELTTVELQGAMASGMGGSGATIPDQRLIAAILDHANGPHFIKVTGSIEAMALAQDSIDDFMLSANPR